MGWQNAKADYRRCLPGHRPPGALPHRPVHRMTPRPLIVRLRNWVGDVILGVPALQLLQALGERVARYSIVDLSGALRARQARLRALAEGAAFKPPTSTKPINATAKVRR